MVSLTTTRRLWETGSRSEGCQFPSGLRISIWGFGTARELAAAFCRRDVREAWKIDLWGWCNDSVVTCHISRILRDKVSIVVNVSA